MRILVLCDLCKCNTCPVQMVSVWMVGLTAAPEAPCWNRTAMYPTSGSAQDTALYLRYLCIISSPRVQKETALGEGRGWRWEKQSVGWRRKDKTRMDRRCCQDLSVVTNGCSKDEASKTLENSDVVNHQQECVHLCVFYMCQVNDWKERTCRGVSQAARCQSWQRPSPMGECWEIDLAGVWGRQRRICGSDYRRKIANAVR